MSNPIFRRDKPHTPAFMDKTTTPAASAAKTAQDTIREYVLHKRGCRILHPYGESQFCTCGLDAALASLKSLDGQEVVAWMATIRYPNGSESVRYAATKEGAAQLGHESTRVSGTAISVLPLVRQFTQPSDPRLSVEEAMEVVDELLWGASCGSCNWTGLYENCNFLDNDPDREARCPKCGNHPMYTRYMDDGDIEKCRGQFRERLTKATKP